MHIVTPGVRHEIEVFDVNIMLYVFNKLPVSPDFMTSYIFYSAFTGKAIFHSCDSSCSV